MKVKSVLAVLFLLAVSAIVLATPDQPFMQAARADLNTARNELQKATPDKAGHRVKALDLVKNAIAEVNAGIAYARQHNHATALNAETLFAGTPDQPHMERALLALNSAKHNLDQALDDKGGHRAKALGLINDAIDEVKKGIEAGKG